MKSNLGFSLLELMVVVVIVGIISALAGPSISGMIEKNKVRAEAQRLAGLLNLARNHAATNNQPLIAYGIQTGGMISIDIYTDDEDATLSYEATDDTYIERSSKAEAGLKIGSSGGFGDNYMRFDDKGRLNDTAGSLTVCDTDKTIGREVSVNLIGRVSVSEITNPASGC